ncbi:protein of unknown function (DUF928) [Nostoc sp. PCC 7524]|uniref:DUF928 domain-containing protein n=1 Tax=Nostoc sp. (strain ATCC 29411 / PCC 7524) TaxID=28072 RepID=UPI00029ED370|nr:DUF928 domain-containing protein [Nostoc sp. PCC 7524]AFY47249.1 protein of unknown function (DUF928) [Nostoc sp. PCC 7524]
MKKILLFPTVILISGITLSIFNIVGNWQPGQAETLISTKKIWYIPPTVKEKPGEPRGRRRGGGSRGPCKEYETLTALVPITNTGIKDVVLGKSTSPNPTFWFFVPDNLNPRVSVEFVIQDEADNYVYQTKFNPPETPSGIVSLLVEPKEPLVSSQSYRWTFSIYCDSEKSLAAVYVQGSMKQVDLNPTLKKQLEVAKTPLERAALFAKNGIWYDALTTLGEQIQSSQSKDPEITSAWAELLQQAKLDSSAAAPIISCCTPKHSRRLLINSMKFLYNHERQARH